MEWFQSFSEQIKHWRECAFSNPIYVNPYARYSELYFLMGAVRFFFAFWVNISEQSSLAELALAAEVLA